MLCLMPARPTVVRIFLAMCATAAVVSSVHATEPRPGEIAPVSIRNAVHMAWRQHPDQRMAEAQLAAARARLEAAGSPIHNPELVVEREDEGPDTTATIGLALALDLGGKRRARQAAAAAVLSQAEAEARQRRSRFVREWLAGWIDLRAADLRQQLGERRLGLVERAATLAERQFAAEDISGLDRDLALLARDEVQARQSGWIAERAEAEARFRTAGGESGQLPGLSLPEGTPPAPVEIDAATLQRLPEWRIAEAKAHAAEREVAVAQRNRTPDPVLGLRGGRVRYDNGLSDNVIGMSLSVPLFVRNGYRAEVVAARADAAAASAEAERSRTALIADSRRAVAGYAATRQAWERWRASRGTDVERRTGLLERLWREGELSTSDYLLQLDQTLDTAMAGIDLESRLWRNYIDYLAAAGQLERWVGLEDLP